MFKSRFNDFHKYSFFIFLGNSKPQARMNWLYQRLKKSQPMLQIHWTKCLKVYQTSKIWSSRSTCPGQPIFQVPYTHLFTAHSFLFCHFIWSKLLSQFGSLYSKNLASPKSDFMKFYTLGGGPQARGTFQVKFNRPS